MAGTATARLPPLLTDATWEPQALHVQRVPTVVVQSPPHGLLVLDDTGLPKPGRGSGGVARQYGGTLGQGAPCQGVGTAPSVADAPTSRAPVHWPVTARLSLPEAWATEQARRGTGHVPPQGVLQTPPALALALVEPAQAWGVPCAGVVAAAGYGDKPPCLPGLDERQRASGGGVSSPFGVRRPAAVRAAALVPPPRPRGRGQPKKPHPAPLSQAQAMLDTLPAARWQTRTWRAHDDGVWGKPGVARRVHGATGGTPLATTPPRVYTGPEGWLLGERPVPGRQGEAQWSYSRLPADTPRPRLVALAHRRWPIAQCDEDATGACGLAHDQGRRWAGLHRHLARVMLADSFLARQRWTPAAPAGLPPRGGAPVLPSRPSPRTPVAVPGGRVMAHRDQSHGSLPSQTDLTK